MKERLIIVGAGGFGREVFNWLSDIPVDDRSWEFVGFLDDNQSSLDSFENYGEIISSISDFEPAEYDRFVVAIGDPQIRKSVSQTLIEKGGALATVIHPTVIIGQGSKIGQGAIICPRVVITANCDIGKGVIFNVASTVGHDAVIGDWCTLNGHCDVTGCANIGDSVFMGSHACVLPSVKISANSVIGAGSVVLRSTTSSGTYFGVPAKKLL